MSDRPGITIHNDDVPPEPVPAPEFDDETSVPALPKLGNQSIVDAIHTGYADEHGDTDKSRVYKVGRAVPALFARYRPLRDEEREALDKHLRARIKQQKRVGQYDESEAKIEEAALVLSRACVELVWDEDGDKKPLHERLGDDTSLRFDRRLIDALGLTDIARFAAADGASDICAAMHYWAGNHGPLLSTYGLYKVWSQGVDVEDLSEALEGN